MDKYYYLVAQLPMLFFGREAEITAEKFWEEAEKWLSRRDFHLLKSLDLGQMTEELAGNPVVRSVSRFEKGVKQDIANWRKAKRLDQEYRPETIPSAYLKEGNPLEKEERLLKLRWDLLDQLEREHHFDIGFVVIYYLKLQILQRLLAFNKEEGLKKFQNLYEVNI